MTHTGERVCVVDDDESVLRAMRRLLHAVGYGVTTFASASDFLASATVDVYDCAILDVRMPGMDGLALQERLTALGSRLPVIFITAHDDARAEERAMRNGAAAFLHKPFSEKMLFDAIREALGGEAEYPASR